MDHAFGIKLVTFNYCQSSGVLYTQQSTGEGKQESCYCFRIYELLFQFPYLLDHLVSDNK